MMKQVVNKKKPEDYINPKAIYVNIDWSDDAIVESYYNIIGVDLSANYPIVIYSEFVPYFISNTSVLINEKDKKIFIYNRTKGVYEEKDSYNISSVVRFLLDQGGMSLFRKNVLAEFETQLNSYLTRQIKTFNAGNYITFNNQAYSLEEFKAVPFSPRHYNTVAIEYDCDPLNNTHPVFDKFLDDFTCGNKDLKILLQEIVGYLFWPNNDAQRSFIFYGPARSGKSTMAKLCTFLLGGEGEDRVIATPLSKLTSEFGLEGIETAKAYIVSETEKGEFVQTSIYKAIVSGDSVSLNEKHRKRTTVVPHCKILTFTNFLPNFSETDPSLERRILIFPCNADINKLSVDTGLLDKLKNEGTAIFNWAMEGLHRLKNSGWNFTETEETKSIVKNYVFENDPMYKFIADRIEQDSTAKFISNKEICDAYTKWAQDNGLPTKVMGFNKIFFSHLESLNFNVTKSRQKGYNGLIGISLKKDE